MAARWQGVCFGWCAPVRHADCVSVQALMHMQEKLQTPFLRIQRACCLQLLALKVQEDSRTTCNNTDSCSTAI